MGLPLFFLPADTNTCATPVSLSFGGGAASIAPQARSTPRIGRAVMNPKLFFLCFAWRGLPLFFLARGYHHMRLFFFLLLAQKKETKKRAAKSNCSAGSGKAHAQVTELLISSLTIFSD